MVSFPPSQAEPPFVLLLSSRSLPNAPQAGQDIPVLPLWPAVPPMPQGSPVVTSVTPVTSARHPAVFPSRGAGTAGSFADSPEHRPPPSRLRQRALQGRGPGTAGRGRTAGEKHRERGTPARTGTPARSTAPAARPGRVPPPPALAVPAAPPRSGPCPHPAPGAAGGQRGPRAVSGPQCASPGGCRGCSGRGAVAVRGRAGLTCAVTMEPLGRSSRGPGSGAAAPPARDALPWQRARPPRAAAPGWSRDKGAAPRAPRKPRTAPAAGIPHTANPESPLPHPGWGL